MKRLLKSFQILVPVLACLVNNLNLAEAVDRCSATIRCTDPTAPCCSRHGYCGSEYPYCGDGCQSQCHVVPSPLSSKYPCGRKASNATCPTAEKPCCSMYGYCGIGKEYCGYGCQSQCDNEGLSSLPSSGSSFLFLGGRGFLSYSSFLCCPILILSNHV
jgi:hypothetical protein